MHRSVELENNSTFLCLSTKKLLCFMGWTAQSYQCWSSLRFIVHTIYSACWEQAEDLFGIPYPCRDPNCPMGLLDMHQQNHSTSLRSPVSRGKMLGNRTGCKCHWSHLFLGLICPSIFPSPRSLFCFEPPFPHWTTWSSSYLLCWPLLQIWPWWDIAGPSCQGSLLAQCHSLALWHVCNTLGWHSSCCPGVIKHRI